MSEKNNTTNALEKTCKKCGEPLRSKNRYKYCDNCRRERAKVRRDLGETIFAFGGIVLSSIPVIKFLNKK